MIRLAILIPPLTLLLAVIPRAVAALNQLGGTL